MNASPSLREELEAYDRAALEKIREAVKNGEEPASAAYRIFHETRGEYMAILERHNNAQFSSRQTPQQ